MQGQDVEAKCVLNFDAVSVNCFDIAVVLCRKIAAAQQCAS